MTRRTAPWSHFAVTTIQPYAECLKIDQRPETLRLRGIPLRKPHGTALRSVASVRPFGKTPPQKHQRKEKSDFPKKIAFFRRICLKNPKSPLTFEQ